MRHTQTIAATTLIFTALTGVLRAEDAPRDPELHVAHQSERAGRRPELLAMRSAAPKSYAPPAASAADPYGFANRLNAYRASAGLPALRYDAELSNWAALNNSQQNARGLGHHVNPNCLQNSCWNTTSVDHTLNTWADSPGHRQNMLASHVRTFGIAYGPGPYWTLNLR